MHTVTKNQRLLLLVEIVLRMLILIKSKCSYSVILF